MTTLPRQPRTMKELAAKIALNLTRAQRDEALVCLQELVALVRSIGGFATHEQQEVIWRCEALLVQMHHEDT